jgi:hypothetical protein
MPRCYLDYPDAFAGWNVVTNTSFGPSTSARGGGRPGPAAGSGRVTPSTARRPGLAPPARIGPATRETKRKVGASNVVVRGEPSRGSGALLYRSSARGGPHRRGLGPRRGKRGVNSSPPSPCSGARRGGARARKSNASSSNRADLEARTPLPSPNSIACLKLTAALALAARQAVTSAAKQQRAQPLQCQRRGSLTCDFFNPAPATPCAAAS